MSRAFLFLLLPAALALGLWRGWSFERAHRCLEPAGEQLEVTGPVLDVRRYPTSQRLLVETGERWPRAIYAYAPPLPAIGPGEMVRVSGAAGNVGRATATARAAGVCAAIRKPAVVLLGDAPGAGPWLLRLGGELAASVGRVLPSPAAEASAGMLLGRGEDLPEEATEAARRAGLAHALVLSGFNVSLAVAWASAAATFLWRPLRLLAGVAAGASLAGVSGFGASATRAAASAALAGFALWRFRRADVARVLLFAVLAMAWANPLALAYSLSLQLSALATLGVIAFGERFALLPGIRALPAWRHLNLREAAAATLAAEAMVAPLIAWRLGSVTLLGLPANVLAGPAVPLAMAAAGVAALLGFVGSPPPAAALLALPARWFLGVSERVSVVSFASREVSLGAAAGSTILLATVAAAGVSVWLERRAARARDAPLLARLREAEERKSGSP